MIVSMRIMKSLRLSNIALHFLMLGGDGNNGDLHATTTTTTATTGTLRNLEVERKFSLLGFDNNSLLSDRLRQAGLKEAGCKEMIDWYFDVYSPSSSSSSSYSPLHEDDYPLIRQDCWLRYRIIIGEEGSDNSNNIGTWQLKQGRSKINQNSLGTTVYEETEGDEALRITQTLLFSRKSRPREEDSKNNASTTPTPLLFEGLYNIPPIPISGMRPFARIATKRSSWIISNDNDIALTVDLDTTDFGHAIGEVEAIVTNSQDVAIAHAKINNLVKQLQVGGSDDDDGAIPLLGKLEYYLKLKRPEILQIIMAGIGSKNT